MGTRVQVAIVVEFEQVRVRAGANPICPVMSASYSQLVNNIVVNNTSSLCES